MICGDKDNAITIKANTTVHVFENVARLKAGGGRISCADFGLRRVVISDDSYRFSSMPERRNRMKTTARLDEPRGRER